MGTRPPGRRGGAGSGPLGAANVPGRGRGTTHKGGKTRPSKARGKSSSVEGTPIVAVVYGIATFVVLTVASVVGYLLHGYGAV